MILRGTDGTVTTIVGSVDAPIGKIISRPSPGPQGPQGPKGDTGAPGTGITVKGTVATYADLPVSAVDTDSYVVAADGLLYTYHSGWPAQGSGILWLGPQGPVGPDGPAGPKGDAGETAYQVAVDNGFVGTQSAWLASLVGPQGPQGIQGPAGSGSGDVTGAASSVDSEVALFSGATGKTLKRATGSGLAKLTSGVLGTATEGADYYGPSGTDVAVTDGGTGASSAAGARTNLGLVVGTDVQAHDSDLDAIAALAPADNDVVQRKAGSWTNRTPAQLKTDLALAKVDVGLGNVDNTSDSAKPVSTATQTALNAKEATANKGVANGYTPLDGSALVPAIYLPSYVDDVLEFTNLAGFPATGVTGKIFVALDTGKIYRWSGSAYVEISPSPGSTDAVPEGTTNKYYTDARADARVTAGITGKADKTTTVAAGTGLTGGGDLSASRTLAVAYGTAAGTAAQGNDSRLSDTRTPTDGTVTDAKVAAGAAIAVSKLGTGKVVGSVNGTSTSLTLWTGTQAQYDAIVTKDATTVYVVTA